MDTLSVIWFAAAGGGAAAGLAGVLLRRHRRRLLGVSAGCFLLCGILGILSVGILFLGLSALVAVAAARSEHQRVAPFSASDPT